MLFSILRHHPPQVVSGGGPAPVADEKQGSPCDEAVPLPENLGFSSYLLHCTSSHVEKPQSHQINAAEAAAHPVRSLQPQ